MYVLDGPYTRLKTQDVVNTSRVLLDISKLFLFFFLRETELKSRYIIQAHHLRSRFDCVGNISSDFNNIVYDSCIKILKLFKI